MRNKNLILRRLYYKNMTSPEANRDSYANDGDASTPTPSRASSVFSTGTYFSIATLSPEEMQSLGSAISERTLSDVTRPRSLRTLASHETPAPPYEIHQVSEDPQTSSAQRRLTAVESPHPLVAGTSYTPSTSPVSEPENALSRHYGRVVRTIDQNHTRELANLTQEHERRLAAIRNEIDQEYRREWKIRNREVEQIREEADSTIAQLQKDATNQIAALVEAHEIATVKARNAIEDLWERRWSDRVRLEAEEAQRRLEQAVADRDTMWVQEMKKRHPELVDELKEAMGGLKADN